MTTQQDTLDHLCAAIEDDCGYYPDDEEREKLRKALLEDGEPYPSVDEAIEIVMGDGSGHMPETLAARYPALDKILMELLT